MSRREWSTDVRDPWNAKIHTILKAIDLHNELYLQTHDKFHLDSTRVLREYVSNLKTWIHSQEKCKEKS